MLLVLLVQGAATGGERFAVFTMVAFVVFVSVLRLALRKSSSCLDQDLDDCSLRCFRWNAVCAMDLRSRRSMVDLLWRACFGYLSHAANGVPNVEG